MGSGRNVRMFNRDVVNSVVHSVVSTNEPALVSLVDAAFFAALTLQ